MIRVLIVDDSMLARKSIEAALAEAPGVQVVGMAGNGEEGLQKMAALKPSLVTCDIEMPVMDGIQMLMQLRKHFPQVKVIMLSSLTQPNSKKEQLCRNLGAHAVLAKPMEHSNVRAASNRAELLATVQRLGAAG
ncbi:MAG: response regulator [Candidatus Lambdaproteobacteria bacterium]|nr:response regulator [Candidatus Lambdaproteobacteria bacterium]